MAKFSGIITFSCLLLLESFSAFICSSKQRKEMQIIKNEGDLVHFMSLLFSE